MLPNTVQWRIQVSEPDPARGYRNATKEVFSITYDGPPDLAPPWLKETWCWRAWLLMREGKEGV